MQYGSTYSTPTTDVDCEMAEHIQRELIELAVRNALENIQSTRLQTNQQILNQTE